LCALSLIRDSAGRERASGRRSLERGKLSVGEPMEKPRVLETSVGVSAAIRPIAHLRVSWPYATQLHCSGTVSAQENGTAYKDQNP